ncbi:DUF1425 domain-containing protein [Pasteurellaceae bacterium LIM206]|nr:DUF1425 domain-containing protein [Pasteurellaceae bacterium LIM206]
MKKYFLLPVILLLTACSAQKPNLVKTTAPILNITTAAAQMIEADLYADTATLRNKTAAPVLLAYDLYWYNAQGVTQVYSPTQEAFHADLLLAARQKTDIVLHKPNASAVIYRLYVRLK